MDFDDFVVDPDAGGEFDEDAENSGENDADDTNDNNEVPGAPGEVGSYCDSDDDCSGDGICMGSVCLTPCETDNDCPYFAGCFQIGPDQLCAPRCQDTETCSHLDFREDLSCVYLVQTREFGASPHSLARACLTDSDDDGVFNGIDNCPADPNPTQRDSSGDGLGDACADHAFCHQEAVDGVLDYDLIPFRAGEFIIPETVQGRWLPVLGTTDTDGAPESTLKLLDRVTGQWKDKGTLRHGGANRNLVSTNRGGYLISPGTPPGSNVSLGAWSLLSPLGELTFPAPYFDLEEESIFRSLFRFSNGAMHQFDLILQPSFDPEDDSMTALALLTDLDAELWGTFTAPFQLFPLADTETPDNWRVQSFAYPDGSQGVAIWRPTTRSIEVFDISAPIASPPFFLQTTSLTVPTSWALPDSGDGGDEEEENDLLDSDPIFLPAPGGQLYIFDRNSGQAARFVSKRPDSDMRTREWGEFERLPEYDLDLFDDLDVIQVYTLPQATGLGLIGRPKGEPATIQVREIYFACHSQTTLLDTDEDGIGDLIDNCPLIENSEQEDLDQDSWGDECDPDIDGDGIPNEFDRIIIPADGSGGEQPPDEIDTSRDSTNSGVDNDESDDVDGDSIPNQYDPFPLDSANNGTPNRWTNDASGNGYDDEFLREHDLSPYNFFSLPTAQRFAYIAENSDGARTLYIGRLTEASQAEAVELPEGVRPHQLSFGPDGDFLVFLGDEPGSADTFYVYHLDYEENPQAPGNGDGLGGDGDELEEEEEVSTGPLVEYESQAKLRSISMVDEFTFIAVQQKEPGSNDAWVVSLISTAPDPHYLEIYSDLPHIWYGALTGPQSLTILASDTDCRECALVYNYEVLLGDLEVPEEVHLRFLPESIHGTEQLVTNVLDMGAALYSPAHPGEPRQVISYGYGATYELNRVVIPEEFDAITSLGFSRFYSQPETPFNDVAPFLMATMSRWDQTPNIWISIPALGSSWHLLLARQEALVEAAWAP